MAKDALDIVVHFPHSDFRRLLIYYRGHIFEPKILKKSSFAITYRLADFLNKMTGLISVFTKSNSENVGLKFNLLF